jgi:hypothetical protein
MLFSFAETHSLSTSFHVNTHIFTKFPRGDSAIKKECNIVKKIWHGNYLPHEHPNAPNCRNTIIFQIMGLENCMHFRHKWAPVFIKANVVFCTFWITLHFLLGLFLFLVLFRSDLASSQNGLFLNTHNSVWHEGRIRHAALPQRKAPYWLYNLTFVQEPCYGTTHCTGLNNATRKRKPNSFPKTPCN